MKDNSKNSDRELRKIVFWMVVVIALQVLSGMARAQQLETRVPRLYSHDEIRELGLYDGDWESYRRQNYAFNGRIARLGISFWHLEDRMGDGVDHAFFLVIKSGDNIKIVFPNSSENEFAMTYDGHGGIYAKLWAGKYRVKVCEAKYADVFRILAEEFPDVHQKHMWKISLASQNIITETTTDFGVFVRK